MGSAGRQQPGETELAQFWDAYTQATGHDGRYVSADPFGDSPELADELIALILDGPKRATAGLLADYERAGDRVEDPGERWVALDGAGRPRAVLVVTETRIGPYSSVDAAFAWDEGEDDRTLESWKREHERYFRRRCEVLGLAWSEDLPVVFHRFEVDWAA